MDCGEISDGLAPEGSMNLWERATPTVRPVLMSAPMVRAILAGQKTMTRRVVVWPEWLRDHDAGAYWLNRNPCAALHKDGRPVRRFCCPYGVPGDLLWVREGHSWMTLAENEYHEEYYAHRRRPDGCPVVMYWRAEAGSSALDVPWRPSIHMPRWASRLMLRVTDVRVERVQEVTEEDAVREGSYLDRCPCMPRKMDRTPIDTCFRQTGCHIHGDSFRTLWDTGNAKRGHPWDMNPFVWVIAFTRLDVP